LGGVRLFLVPSVLAQLQEWAALVQVNRPRSLVGKHDITDVIATDASGLGWGCCHLSLLTGRLSWYSGAWPESFERKGVSTSAESCAVLKALMCCVPPLEPRTVLLLTDASVTAIGLNKARAKSYHVNYYLSRIQELFPNTLIVARHISGESNVADGLSRGVGLQQPQEEVTEWLRREHGVTYMESAPVT
jgi:hypothetical protein